MSGAASAWRLVLTAAFMYSRTTMIIYRRMLCLLALVLTVSSLAPAARRNIVLTLDKKEIRNLTSSGLVLIFQIEVANASSNVYSLSEYDYRVVVEGSDLFAWRTTLDQPITVEKGGKTLIALPIKIAYADVFKSIPGRPRARRSSTAMLRVS